MIKNMLAKWLFIIPSGIIAGWLCKWFVSNLTLVDNEISRMALTGFLFTSFFILIVFLADNQFRSMIRNTKNVFFLRPVIKKL